MEDRFLSRFTPSLMTPDALEAIFVQREKLLQEILERIRKSALGSEKKNTLLVGPRGIGKTHLISMIYHRLQSMKPIQEHLLIAWMREEEWGVASFRDLLLRILRALVPEDDARLVPIYSLASQEAETAALQLIKELAGDRTLLILVENLDDLFRKLGSSGEMQFCLFLQQNRCCVTATSPGPAARVFPPGSPFRRDFFQIHQLNELSFEDAIQLISRVAEYQDNKKLVSLLSEPRGRARVRALRHLAGGNHRAYVIFAPLLTLESVGDLVRPLMETIDDLTPYYNSRITALPWEQRQIIEYVCEVRHPVRTGDVSRACFLPRAAASAQLEALCAMGHLNSIRVGENSYYELREPLMRLSFEVKKHRGKPIGLLLDFLRLWYSPAELKQKLSATTETGVLDRSLIPDPQLLEQDWEDPRITECCRDYSEAVRKEDYEHAVKALEDLAAIRGSKQDSIAQVSCLARLGRYEQAVAVCDKILNVNRDDAFIWRLRASVFQSAGNYEEALSSCKTSLELDKDALETWKCEASILLNMGHPEEALYSCEAALKLNDKDPVAWTTLGLALADLHLFEESFRAFTITVELEPTNAKARVRLCAALIELNRWEEAQEQARYAVKLNPDEPEPWVLHGSALAGTGNHEEALAALNKAVSLGEDSSYVQFKSVELLLSLDRWREGVARLDQALQQFAHSENPNAGDTKAFVRCLMPSLSDPRVAQISMKLLLLIYRKHGMLGALGQGLIECIPDVISSARLDDATALLWLDCWQTAAGQLSEFRLPLRLLDSATRYRNNRDTETFMNLPQEERTFLEALIGIQAEAIA